MRSKGRVQKLVDLLPQCDWVYGRKVAPPLEQRVRCQARWRDGAQFRDSLTGSGDRDRLAAGSAVNYLASLVPQIADAYI
jgi:hypothetical protein